MPDRAGAFLKASRVISSEGANISRVSYNQAVDTHTLFIDVSGTERQLSAVTHQLENLGYISDDQVTADIMLVELRLIDIPGAILPILELIESFSFNISYINLQGNGTDYQSFRMGLRVTDPEKIKEFLENASKLCDVKIIDYDKSKKVLDNTVFYLSFASEIAAKMSLGRESTNQLISDSNLIMQMLDENDEPAYKVFDKIGEFADLIKKYKGSGFATSITRKAFPGGVSLCVIEPPCGSNTAILEKDGQLLFVDSGFACYENELKLLLTSLYPDFARRRKYLAVTHPDIDHCGMADIFDTIYLSRKSLENFTLEQNDLPSFREQNPKHAPYCRISKILTSYTTPAAKNIAVVDGEEKGCGDPISLAGHFDFCGIRFDVYKGNGGHAEGEIVIVCEELKIVFSGDIVVNISGFSKQQQEFNAIAPYLMTSVNTNPSKATEEREFLLQLFEPSKYMYCCGHGAPIEKSI